VEIVYRTEGRREHAELDQTEEDKQRPDHGTNDGDAGGAGEGNTREERRAAERDDDAGQDQEETGADRQRGPEAEGTLDRRCLPGCSCVSLTREQRHEERERAGGEERRDPGCCREHEEPDAGHGWEIEPWVQDVSAVSGKCQNDDGDTEESVLEGLTLLSLVRSHWLCPPYLLSSRAQASGRTYTRQWAGRSRGRFERRTDGPRLAGILFFRAASSLSQIYEVRSQALQLSNLAVDRGNSPLRQLAYASTWLTTTVMEVEDVTDCVQDEAQTLGSPNEHQPRKIVLGIDPVAVECVPRL
jgi:hypothetical protein